MKPFAARALAILLPAAALVGAAATGAANVRLLPANASGDGSTAAPNQNISVRWTDIQETTVAGLGTGFRARFNQPYAYVSSMFANVVDGTGYDGMYFLLKNVGTTVSSSTVELQSVYNREATGRLSESVTLQPGQSKRVIIYLNRNDPGKQLGVAPPALDVPAQILWGGKWNFDITKVNGWYMWNSGGAATVELQDLRLIKKRPNLVGMIDAYGQSSDLDWPKKVKTDGDLLDRAQEEEEQLATTSDAATAVGSTLLGRTRATGKWRFERAATGNWFAVDPDGKRTWIVGANNAMIDGRMILDGKEELYASLPPRESALGQFYGTATYFATGQRLRNYDMYRANLYKKYGTNYERTWLNRLETRMKKWGVNAVAGTLDRNVTSSGMPYIPATMMFYFDKKLVVSNPGWAHPNDPFAATFPAYCVSHFKSVYASEIPNSPRNLIGIAVGNEDSWGWVRSDRTKYQIPFAALNAPISQACKQPLLDKLRAKYGTIAALNAAWGRSFASWDAMKPAGAFGEPTITPALKADLSLLLSTYADKNYSVIRAALLKAGYKGMFAGSRVALDNTPDEVLQAEDRYVDVHTINNYEVDDASWTRISKLTKPVLLTEFSVSSVDRGHYLGNKGFEVGTQQERGERVTAYLRRAAGMKNVAGAFFYGFAECPFTGRWSDDERMNVGLVDMTDTPYAEVTSALRNFGNSLPALRRY